MTLLIAEISNHHMGSIEKAKELIRIAKESGAAYVKGQAFEAKDMLKWGTMPLSFYEKCALKYHEYKELILYGDNIGIPVFFTILSPKLSGLGATQEYKKLHAELSKICRKDKFWHYDKDNVFISMKSPRIDVKEIKKAKLLYATEYLEDLDLEGYETLQRFYMRTIGVSHHGKVCNELYKLQDIYDIPWVEKHFYLGDPIIWEGQTYRDCLHSFTPSEFEFLVRNLN